MTPTQETEPNFEPITTPLEIEPASLPDAQVGVMYETEIRITQNVTPVGAMEITQGSLPAGLEFVFMDGEDFARLSGIPEEAGTFTFTFFAWCYGTQVSGQTLEKEFQIVVNE